MKTTLGYYEIMFVQCFGKMSFGINISYIYVGLTKPHTEHTLSFVLKQHCVESTAVIPISQ